MTQFIEAPNTLLWFADQDDVDDWDEPSIVYADKIAVCIGDLDCAAATIVGTRAELRALWQRLGGVISAAELLQAEPDPGPSEFCDFCGLQMLWDDELGWVDIADGAKTICEKSPDGGHLVTYDS
jgi:hypothetical protein